MRRLAGLALALALAACARQTAPLPPAPVPAGPAIDVAAEPLPMDPRDPANVRIGAFAYAGGLALTSHQTSRLHGLSDLKVWPDGRLLAVGDQGDLLEARLVLDARGGLSGVTAARLTPVLDDQGRQVTSLGDREQDAEGIAEFADGGRIISFEQHDRAYHYPPRGAQPRPAPQPGVRYVFNKGMEALAAYPAIAPDAYLVGLENTGETFVCRVSAPCRADRKVDVEGIELTALAPLPDGRVAYLLRTYIPVIGNRVILKILARDGSTVDRLELAKPLTIDNFEGLAAVPRRDGSVRFYLLSDDNFSATQRTLLLAFDWTPEAR